MAFPLLCIVQPARVEIRGRPGVKPSLRSESDKRAFQRIFPDASMLGIDC